MSWRPVYGEHGAARVRRSGIGARRRWFVIAPLEDGELLTCVFHAALPRDLKAEGAFVMSAAGLPEAPGELDSSMRLCVSARMAEKLPAGLSSRNRPQPRRK
jgi:hypothetical protein